MQSSTMVSSPSGPALSDSGPASSPTNPGLVSAGSAVTVITRSSPGRDALADPGEQIVLRDRAVHQRPGQLEVLGRPHLALERQRDSEPEPGRIDLGGMSEQRLIP